MDFTYVKYTCAVRYVLYNCMTPVSRRLYMVEATQYVLLVVYGYTLCTHPGTCNTPSGFYKPTYTYMTNLFKPHVVYLHVSVYVYT